MRIKRNIKDIECTNPEGNKREQSSFQCTKVIQIIRKRILVENLMHPRLRNVTSGIFK